MKAIHQMSRIQSIFCHNELIKAFSNNVMGEFVLELEKRTALISNEFIKAQCSCSPRRYDKIQFLIHRIWNNSPFFLFLSTERSKRKSEFQKKKNIAQLAFAGEH